MIGEWESFFVAQTGAFAALAGLVVVALSINLEKIISMPGLPGRAAEAITLMVLPVFTGLTALVPTQGLRTLGLEYLVIGVGAAGIVIQVLRGAPDDDREREFKEVAMRPIALVAVAPTVVAGLLLAGGNSSGLDWVAAGTLLCLFAGIVDAWVLLVEILR